MNVVCRIEISTWFGLNTVQLLHCEYVTLTSCLNLSYFLFVFFKEKVKTLFLISYRKMEWTSEHEILLCREVIAFELYTHKPGSKERGQCLDRISESLNSIEDLYFKVDQRSVRDKLKKLLKKYVHDKNEQEKASGIEVQHTEMDDLLLEIYELQQQCEKDAAAASEEKVKKQDQERQAAEEI